MKSLNSIEIHYLIRELQQLVGGRIDTIYHLDKKDFLFQFHVPNEGRKLVRFRIPYLFYFMSEKPQTPQSPSSYCMHLRKKLEQSRVVSISARAIDRVVEILVDAKEGRLMLLFEFYSKGNLYLAKDDLTVISSLDKEHSIAYGEKYPSPERVPLLRELLVQKSTLDGGIGIILAKSSGLGRLYSEELCRRANVDSSSTTLDQEEIGRLVRLDPELFLQPIQGIHYLFEGKIVEATPFLLQQYASYESKSYATYSQALETLPDESAPKKEGTTKGKKYLTIIEKQEQSIKSLESEILENQKKGEVIYTHYQELQGILSKFKAALLAHNLQELQTHITPRSIVCEISTRKKTLTIDLDNIHVR